MLAAHHFGTIYASIFRAQTLTTVDDLTIRFYFSDFLSFFSGPFRFCVLRV